MTTTVTTPHTIATTEDLEALRGSGVAGVYLFRDAAWNYVLAWETEDGDLVGTRPINEDDGPFCNMPESAQKSLAVRWDPEPPLTLVWHDGEVSR